MTSIRDAAQRKVMSRDRLGDMKMYFVEGRTREGFEVAGEYGATTKDRARELAEQDMEVIHEINEFRRSETSSEGRIGDFAMKARS